MTTQAIDVALLETLVTKAKQNLPKAAAGRVDKAAELVIAGAVTLQGGSATVKNGKGKTYHINGQCDCPDYQHKKAPGGWCKHRIAVALAKRLAEAERMTTPSADTPTPLPEAPASANLKILLGTVPVMITLRDTDEERLMQRLDRFLKRYAR